MAHRFRVGQSVVRAPRAHSQPQVYTIMRLLPELPNGEPQYQIKAVNDGMQRVVRQGEIQSM